MQTRSQTRAQDPTQTGFLTLPTLKRTRKKISTAHNTSRAPVAFLDQLPEEILEQIIAHLKVGSLITLTKTGGLIRRWLIAKTDLWSGLLSKHVSITYFSGDPFREVVRLYAKRRCRGCNGVVSHRAAKHPFFGIRVCTECMETDDYATMTVTRAKAEFRLNDRDIADLDFKTRRNPHNPRGPPMRFYMMRDLRRISEAKHAANNTTLEEATEKAVASKRKRRENRDAAEHTRREALSNALAEHGLTVREDSRLCEAYVTGRWHGFGKRWTLEEVVSRMRTMHILHEHTDYRNILDRLLEDRLDILPRFLLLVDDFEEAALEAELVALKRFDERQKRYGQNALRCHCGVFIG